jgi:hypothetical protein
MLNYKYAKVSSEKIHAAQLGAHSSEQVFAGSKCCIGDNPKKASETRPTGIFVF